MDRNFHSDHPPVVKKKKMHVNIKGRREDEKDLFDVTIRTPGEGPCLPESDGFNYVVGVAIAVLSNRNI